MIQKWMASVERCYDVLFFPDADDEEANVQWCEKKAGIKACRMEGAEGPG